MKRSISLLTCLATASPVLSQSAGSIVVAGQTIVSTMMMFLGNEEKVYMLDKSEGNAVQLNGHPAMGSVWDIASRTATAMEIRSNAFCSSGMHLPNGSYVTFGGNGAIGPGGNIGSVQNPGGGSGAYDATYMDYDGAKSIRILNPCKSTDDFSSANCQWFDNANVLSMQMKRWYAGTEALADGSIVIVGGFVNGGYVNRNWPNNNDPTYEGGAAEPTFEFFPSRGTPAVMNFMTNTSGLNSYAHTYLMPSGKMLVQAKWSTIMWDYNNNIETYLPDMPGNVARVYPASGAVAMLPLTPANNYVPTVLFCGGSDMPDDAWGNYSWPFINTWEYPASKDCQRLTPEPADGSTPKYEQDDDLLVGRTMGQFIALPDGTMLIVNGGANGTAGYSTQTLLTLDYGQMPYGMSLASAPVLTPSIYNPKAAKGSRWSSAGLSAASLPRLYHSSAILLPDASVLIAGSNPNVDVNLTTIYPTTYTAEIFYPPYFSASVRPKPTGVPKTISYGGSSFDLTVPSNSYSGSANDAADNTTVMLIRPGWTTHGMNMGQRSMQLNNTYTVNSDGSIVLHVAQAPPTPAIFQPGPALLFVVIDGIPSNGTMVIVGNGVVGTQPTSAASVLPASVKNSSAAGSGTSSSSDGKSTSGSTSKTTLIAGIVGAIAVIGILGALVGVCVSRRRRAASRQAPSAAYAMSTTGGGALGGGMGMGMGGNRDIRNSDSSAFVPLHQGNESQAWNASQVSLHQPYKDDGNYGGRSSGFSGASSEFDPYSREPRSAQPLQSQNRW